MIEAWWAVTSVLHFESLPVELRTGMIALWTGGCESCIELMNFRGSARADVSTLAQDIATVSVVWEPG